MSAMKGSIKVFESDSFGNNQEEEHGCSDVKIYPESKKTCKTQDGQTLFDLQFVTLLLFSTELLLNTPPIYVVMFIAVQGQ